MMGDRPWLRISAELRERTGLSAATNLAERASERERERETAS